MIPGVFQTNEVVMLILGLSALVFMMANDSRLGRLPDYRLLRLSFYSLLFAWLFTNIEAVHAPSLMNLFEHTCYLLATIGVCTWVLRNRTGEAR